VEQLEYPHSLQIAPEAVATRGAVHSRAGRGAEREPLEEAHRHYSEAVVFAAETTARHCGLLRHHAGAVLVRYLVAHFCPARLAAKQTTRLSAIGYAFELYSAVGIRAELRGIAVHAPQRT